MLLADRVTYIHEPKTGGTFVRHVLSRLHGGLVEVPPSRLQGPALRAGLPSLAFYPELLRTRRRRPLDSAPKYGALYTWNDHGTCSEIPKPHRSRTILATLRNPLETYVSMYLFGWWKRPEYIPDYERTVPDFRARYPDFPDVSFREYLELLHAGCILPATRNLDDPTGIGYLTQRFVHFYFRLPRRLGVFGYDAPRVLARVDSHLNDGSVRDAMFDVHFIRTSRLNGDLADFLYQVGYDPHDLEFVERLEHVVPTGGEKTSVAERAAAHDWWQYYTPELRELVRKRDRLIFSLFPELDATSGPAS